MRVLRSLQFMTALVLCLLLLVLVATPQMHLIILWDIIRDHDPVARRARFSRWYLWWSVAEWHLFTSLMGIRTAFDLPLVGGSPPPVIVIANHRSSLDSLLVPCVLRRMGYRKLTAIVKREASRFPVVGRVAKEIRAGLVARNGDPADLERVRECAEHARDDGACVLIFPEGTVLECGTRRGNYHEVLVPKVGGMRAIREALPDLPVLSLTIDWGGKRGATSIYTAWTLVGARISIRGRFLDAAMTARPVEEWLAEEWDAKERLLANASAARILRRIKEIRARMARK